MSKILPPVESRDALVEFLRAHFRKDEIDAEQLRAALVSDFPGIFAMAHPDRTAEDLKGKRYILGLHTLSGPAQTCLVCHEPIPCSHLKALALPYAQWPEYLPQWRLF